MNMYSGLLPGITNVTDRARYFSFYPWVLHQFAIDDDTQRTKQDWRGWIRRLDFCFACCCVAHELLSDTAGKQTAAAAVGGDMARRMFKGVDPDAMIDLAGPTRVDRRGQICKGAYFQTREGGFGQYYKSQIKALGLLQEDSKNKNPDLTLTTWCGLPMARALDAQPAFEELLRLARSGEASVARMAALGEYVNLAAIEPGGEEQRLLRGLFLEDLDEDQTRGQDVGERRWRQKSLLLILCYLREAGEVEGTLVNSCRWAFLQGELPDGQPWEIPEVLARTARTWAVYQINDQMNYVLECLLWVTLRIMEEGGHSLESVVTGMVHQSMAALPALDDAPALPSLGGTVEQWLDHHRRDNGGTPGEATEELFNNLWAADKADHDQQMAGRAVRLLARLADEASCLGSPLIAAPPKVMNRVLKQREITIGTFLAWTQASKQQHLEAFLSHLMQDWIIFRHLRVATGKLANQGDFTFKFIQQQGELAISSNKLPEPTLTNPRLKQAANILTDLGYMANDGDISTITPDGERVVKEFLT